MAGAVTNYHQIVQDLLTAYSQSPYLQADLKDETIFDQSAGRYLLVTVGWQGRKRINTIVLHLDVVDDQVIIQCNNTDQDINQELIAAGIPATAIVRPQPSVVDAHHETIATMALA